MLSKIQLIINNLSKIGMNYLSQRAKLNPSSLFSRQLGEIPQIFSKSPPRKTIIAFCLKSSWESIAQYYSNNSLQFKKKTLDIDYIVKNSYNMLSTKRITRVRFTEASRTANQPSTSPTTSRAPNQRSNSPSDTRAASSTQISTPTFLAPFSNVSTPLTPSQQIPKFDHIKNKIFSKTPIASLTSKDAVLKEIRDCILTNNEGHLNEINPYIHSYWRDLHVHSG